MANTSWFCFCIVWLHIYVYDYVSCSGNFLQRRNCRDPRPNTSSQKFFPQNFKFLLTKLRKLSPLPLTAGPITPQGVDPPLQRFNLEEIARSQG